MLFNSPQQKEFQDSSIIPLINVVFLILIFLVIAGQIKSSELFEVDLPESISQSTPAEEVLTLIVNEQTKLVFENELVELNEITTKVSDARSDRNTYDADVLVKVDGSLMVTELRPILAQLKAAGLHKVSIATLQGRLATE